MNTRPTSNTRTRVALRSVLNLTTCNKPPINDERITLISAGVLVAVAVIVAAGVVWGLVLPPRAHIVTVGNASYNAGDLVPYATMLIAGNAQTTDEPVDAALKMLKNRLYQMEAEKQAAVKAAMDANKADVTFGSQIRSYVFQPYTMVNDHRTGRKDGNAQAVLDGDLDPFIRDVLLRRTAEDGDAVAES
mgnify:CR=1 FL=1